jgi:hypothetical protein
VKALNSYVAEETTMYNGWNRQEEWGNIDSLNCLIQVMSKHQLESIEKGKKRKNANYKMEAAHVYQVDRLDRHERQSYYKQNQNWMNVEPEEDNHGRDDLDACAKARCYWWRHGELWMVGGEDDKDRRCYHIGASPSWCAGPW